MKPTVSVTRYRLPSCSKRARRRIQRLEQAVLDAHLGACESVQKRRLADVRVPRERDAGCAALRTLLPPHLSLLAEVAQAAAQERDLAAGDSPVGLELGLTGPSRADSRAERTRTATEALEVLPHAAHPRQVVLELGELDLKLSLCARGVLGEDVEDQLRSIDDARRQGVLERALLRRLELAVDEQHLRLRVAIRLLQLFELALPHVRSRVRARTLLDELADRLHTRRACELAQLAELLLGVGRFREDGQHESAFGLDAVAGASSRWGLCHACRRCPPSPTGSRPARSSS